MRTKRSKAKSAEQGLPMLPEEIMSMSKPLVAIPAEVLFKSHKPTFKAAIRMLCGGANPRTVADACQISQETVADLRVQYAKLITGSRDLLERKVRVGALMAAERVIDLLPTCNDVAVAANVLTGLTGKMQSLAGEVQERKSIEVSTRDAIRAMVEAAPAVKIIDGQIVESPALKLGR